MRGVRRLVLLGCVVAACVSAWSASAIGASQTTDTAVTATFVSSTTLDPSGCASGAADSTSFGVLLPRDKVASNPVCEVDFGSSIPGATLRIVQTDGLGEAMFKHTDGAADTNFSGDGKVIKDFAPAAGADHLRGVTVLADGGVAAVGQCPMAGVSGDDACLVKYDITGNLAWSVTTATAPLAAGDYPWAIAVQPDQKLVTAGYCNMGGGSGLDFCLAR